MDDAFGAVSLGALLVAGVIYLVFYAGYVWSTSEKRGE